MKPTEMPPAADSGRTSPMESALVVALALVAVAAIVRALQFPALGHSTDVGAGRFPLIYASALLLLCAMALFRPFARRKPALEEAPGHDSAGWPRVLQGALASFACLGAMPYLGFLLASGLLMAFLMRLLGMKHRLWNPVLAVLLVLLIHLCFAVALKVPLPAGSWFE